MAKKLLFIVIVALCAFSCIRHKNITYLRGTGYAASDSLIQTTYNLYKLQPFDVLYIKVSSIDQESSEMFNSISGANVTTLSSGSAMYLTGYTIDTDGMINMPLIGKLYVQGLTVNETEALVKENINKYLSDARIVVKLTSFKVTLLGEIASGAKTISADRANILEVFAMAGDISRYGNRRNVLLLRTTPKGVRTYRIDVTSDKLIESPFFYVQPNDLFYVEPLRNASFRISLSEYALVLSAVTTTISTFFLIKTLTQ